MISVILLGLLLSGLTVIMGLIGMLRILLRCKMGNHVHVWRFYDGALGYQSYTCKVCGIDQAELRDRLTLEQLSVLEVQNG
jgi:hypothetical protein